jgi:hypothetical protein
VNTIDNTTRIDANNVDMFVTNHGSFALDLTTGGAGLFYPKGTPKTAVYAAGLWIGAKVNGETRVAIGEYDQEYVPGPTLNGMPQPDRPEFRVYKINAGDTLAEDYLAWKNGLAGGQRPPLDSLGNPLILGDQTLWAVYNDADASAHQNRAGTSLPLGVEVEQTTFEFDRQGALGNAVFMKFVIRNTGSNTLEDTYVSLWSDPDLGGAADDLVAADTSRSLGYVYNATNNDDLYGGEPPAVGYDFLQGPIVNGDTLGMASFNKYINGTDPSSKDETYNYMQGLNADGTVAVDPTTGQSTRYQVPGDPVTGKGWLDTNPADRRLMLSSGPFRMLPGDTQVVVAAIICAQGTDRLSSIALMKCYDDEVQRAYDAGFNLASPPPSPRVVTQELDRAVRLLWDTSPVGTVSVQPALNQRFEFQGFNVYQCPTNSSSGCVKIATFDISDTVITTYSDVCDPRTGLVQRLVIQRGPNEGLAYELTITNDAIRGGPLSNARDYYFAVTSYAYDVNHTEPFASGLLAETLESSINPIRVTPGGSTATLEQTVEHTVGTSNGRVDLTYVDQAAVTGDTYTVTFNDTSDVGTTYTITDVTTGQVKATGLTDQTGTFTQCSGTTTSGCSPIVDGVLVRVTSPVPAVNQVVEVSACGEAVDPPDNVENSRNSTGVWRQHSLDTRATSRHTWNNPTDHDYEIRFLAEPTEYAWEFTGACGAPVLSFRVPVEVWDITTNTRMTPQVRDEGDGKFGWGDGIYFEDIPYNSVNWETATTDDEYDPDCSLLTFRRFFFFDANDDAATEGWPCGGTVVRVITNKPNTSRDVFTYTTRPVGSGPGTVITNQLSAIRVVPNPYLNRSRYEQTQFNRILKFTNLPASRNVTIRIFNLGGDLVRTLHKTDPEQAIMTWNLLTERDLPVASGVYIYHINAEGFGETTGQMIIFTEKEHLIRF